MTRVSRWPTRVSRAALHPLAAGVLLAASGSSFAEALPSTATPAVEQDAKLGTVTVNARRREETAQDVPTPISVLDSETLETQRIYRVQDLQQLVPSTNVAYVHARQSSISIRGLGNNPANDGLEGSVGIYLDNVYLGRPGMAVFDLLDVEQLEVLRASRPSTAKAASSSRSAKMATCRPRAASPGRSATPWPGASAPTTPKTTAT